ncbi:porphobilinogen deaminase [Tistrella bauzanensis]|uniref:Porphobilinogen deaminase n=1 Tax=Tistrella bauzanensis TaxID=657419 RepID=A0ABQ1IK02_9PROT|nr:hydroxymethylbilane synthase [Tistrella bauzanensis]GGB39711.1 porphobilinogen deaminase [Tistrella bauzanensis]
MVTHPLLRIGTRGSPLALAQANEVRGRLAAIDPDLARTGAVEVVVIRTTGDRVQDRTLVELGGKGLFTKEIEEALISGAIDLAVHSMKDMPTELPPGLIIGALLPREDPRDAFLSLTAATLDDLPAGAVVGTASLRRQAQLLAARPDLVVVPVRGNVQTRLERLREGRMDATLLAMAGLNRLKLTEVVRSPIDPAVMLPAVAQGAIGIECRAADDRTAGWVRALNDPETAIAVEAERGLLAVLDGSCRTPIAALAVRPASDEAAGTITLTGRVASPDGATLLEEHLTATVGRGDTAAAQALGRRVGQALRDRAGDDIARWAAGVTGQWVPGSGPA